MPQKKVIKELRKYMKNAIRNDVNLSIKCLYKFINKCVKLDWLPFLVLREDKSDQQRQFQSRKIYYDLPKNYQVLVQDVLLVWCFALKNGADTKQGTFVYLFSCWLIRASILCVNFTSWSNVYIRLCNSSITFSYRTIN